MSIQLRPSFSNLDDLRFDDTTVVNTLEEIQAVADMVERLGLWGTDVPKMLGVTS